MRKRDWKTMQKVKLFGGGFAVCPYCKQCSQVLFVCDSVEAKGTCEHVFRYEENALIGPCIVFKEYK